MKILLTSIGTRGDIEPFLSIGEILERKGHQVVFSFPEHILDRSPKPTIPRPIHPQTEFLSKFQRLKFAFYIQKIYFHHGNYV